MNHGIPFSEALRFWWKLGWISFGGPAGQIAIMHRELVEAKRWISERRFLHALNYCMVLPGPEAQQLATYLGWLMHGTWGGIAAGALFVLPSFFILIALSWLYMVYAALPVVAAVLYGVKAAVLALVLAAAWRIGTRTLKHPLLWGVAVAAFVALFAFSAPFPLILAVAAAIGWLAVRVRPDIFADSAHGKSAASADADDAVINSKSTTPEHCEYSHRRLAVIVVVTLLLGLGGAGLIAALFGTGSTPLAMAWFFTKAAFLTFGGAYAVLPYVFDAAVQDYQWLTAAQMMDGLALGESTPGPLIMVVTFVGFVGGWTDAARAASGALLSGPAIVSLALVCALAATFFTFLPSFFFILAGGPLVEATHNEVRLTGPLTCITAAVVGVIVNLAVFFGWHVLWPSGTAAAPLAGGFDVSAALMAAAAFAALVRGQANVVTVIAASGLAGWVMKTLF
ncbi:MAG: chromate efflux transporter [Betaproteobacteria bacterium]|nr:chromate efflux transporter [Betaproteobacteria bacterium]